MSSVDLSSVVKTYDVRGLVPQQLNAPVARALGAAFATVVVIPSGRTGIVIGHDMRPSSEELVEAFSDGVTRAGIDVSNIGLASTDELYYASGALDVPGAMFTASHNPARYNGIKLCGPAARGISQDTGLAEMSRLAEEYLSSASLDAALPSAEVSGRYQERDLLADYAAKLRGLVDLSGIRPLKIVIDAGNGMSGLTVPAVLGAANDLERLPLEIIELFFELDGNFPNHEANPLEPDNLRDLIAAVKQHDADLGLAFDGDADRCFAVDERGVPVSPSAVTALVAEREIARARALGEERPVVLHNLITSQCVPETIARAGGRAIRTRVGHSLIKTEMARTSAVFAGEHSAHYYFRDFFGADTGMLAALHLLSALGHTTGTLSELVAEYSQYVASGEINSTVQDAQVVLEAVRQAARSGEFGTAEIDELDGLTVSYPADGWWFNLRPSNTEPLLRLNCEAQDIGSMSSIRDRVLAIIADTGSRP
ncbi:phosphomannomutase/phosphoglucomutase [Saxibacter everestensis]|uniref:Phosphomannomutase/phosphoglucomutase n=1 Tax=Saxibacter everestensis TaxID=2909229 RepID=A0ABY8QQK1_9MICO|nr:phosphomannomutase/phosphoglucomutase [Brevibacteriaceae bacterium ZFBP1038]